MAEYVYTKEELAKQKEAREKEAAFQLVLSNLIDDFYTAIREHSYGTSRRWRDFIAGQAIAEGIVKSYVGD